MCQNRQVRRTAIDSAQRKFCVQVSVTARPGVAEQKNTGYGKRPASSKPRARDCEPRAPSQKALRVSFSHHYTRFVEPHCRLRRAAVIAAAAGGANMPHGRSYNAACVADRHTPMRRVTNTRQRYRCRLRLIGGAIKARCGCRWRRQRP
jgi:hypothetical protein